MHEISKNNRVVVRISVCVVLAACCFSCAHAPVSAESDKNGINPGEAVIEFYRGPLNRLSAVRRGRCPMHPSCSEYSRQCYEKHGFFIGTIMTFDRLMRCGKDEVSLAPSVVANGIRKTWDPVESNDFWWNDSKSFP